jgi:acetyl esterase/lipase
MAGNFKKFVIFDPPSTALYINARTEKGWIPFLLLIRKLNINAWRVALLTCVMWRIHPTSVSAADADGVPAGITVLHNLHYREGTDENCRLDLAMPHVSMGKLRPAIVVIHGGGWLEGDKSSFSTPANRPPGNILDFAGLGFVAITINYRLSGEAPFPAALNDCRCAVRWLRANAEKYKIDPNSIGAWGNSAGGHLALMLAMADTTSIPEDVGPYPEYSSRVQAVVSDSGPVDLLYQYEHNEIPTAIAQFLGGAPHTAGAAAYEIASPIRHISPETPPVMLIYGGADTQVGVETADRFVIALSQAGLKDINYHRLGTVGHCPHSLIRVPWLVQSVNDFFLRTLQFRPDAADNNSPDANPESAELPRLSHVADMTLKTESFDHDPGWIGVNNRSATHRDPIAIRQDFGYSAATANVGGGVPGEIGGFITPAGEAAFYGKSINRATLDQPLRASGTLYVGSGGTNILLGFFNSQTANEWRTPNTVAIRINGRGEKFFAYVEYCTSKWRAGGDTTPFPAVTDPETGRWNLIGYPCNHRYEWTLNYDPQGNDGQGVVIATVGGDTAVCKLDASHRNDGAIFDHFGILNVMKSADSGSEVWLDQVSVNGGSTETFDQDPRWHGQNNRQLTQTRLVRPWFDFGFSDTHFSGGKARGELGGQIFRGDCREVARMACYGDRVGPLTLDRRLKASGRIAMTRGVSDSTTFFGFYHSQTSMRQNESQNDGVPEGVLGIHIEGPSSEGFKFYPVTRMKEARSTIGTVRDFPTIRPDRQSHDWSFEYDPNGAGGNGTIQIMLDEKTGVLPLGDGDKSRSVAFDRFGIVTSWIDGNSQNVYLDDITYTVSQE